MNRSLAAHTERMRIPTRDFRQAVNRHEGPTRGAPERQRTLTATIDWSYSLLDDAARRTLVSLAVFVGGATIEAVHAVTGGALETLEDLVAKSLLVRRRPPEHTPSRVAMLQTIRAFASQRLDASADREALRERHCRYYLGFAERHGAERAISGERRHQHVALLDAENQNLDEALRWAVAHDQAELALRLTAALGQYWVRKGRYARAAAWLDAALSLPGADELPAARTNALDAKLSCDWSLERGDPAAIVDEMMVLAHRSEDPALLARAFAEVSFMSFQSGRFADCVAEAAESLTSAERSGDAWEIALAQVQVALTTHSSDAARLIYRASDLLEKVGNVWDQARLFVEAAYNALWGGDNRAAWTWLERALPRVRSLDEPFMWLLYYGILADTGLLDGDVRAADVAPSRARSLPRRVGAGLLPGSPPRPRGDRGEPRTR